MIVNNTNMDFFGLARIYITTLVCGFILCSVTFQNSYNISFALLVFSYPLFVNSKIRQKICLNIIEKSLIGIMLIYFGTFLIEVTLFNEEIRILDKPAKVLLFIPLILLLNALKIDYRYIAGAFVISSGLLLLVAGYEKLILNQPRVGSDINAIQFGAIAIGIASAALALTLTITLEPIHSKKRQLIAALFFILASGGLFAGILSQSKGSIIAIPFIIVLIASLYLSKLKLGKVKAASLISLVLILTSIVLYLSPLKERFARSIKNTIAYTEGTKTKSSSGIRLGLWQTSIEAGSLSPIIGIGDTAFINYKNEQVNEGRFGKELLRFDNSHNSYANAFARRGLIGLTAVILFLGFPIYVGLHLWRRSPQELKPYATAITAFGCVFFIANITQEVIFLNTGIIMYTGLLVILTSMLAERIKACKSDPPE